MSVVLMIETNKFRFHFRYQPCVVTWYGCENTENKSVTC